MKNEWDDACKILLIRGNQDVAPAPLEPGVCFFVGKLEGLGCQTEWSCEGHPKGFYIVFHGPHRVAKEIAAIGIFTVSLWPNGGWKLTITAERDAYRYKRKWTNKMRRKHLRLAAAFWIDHFCEADDQGRPISLTVDPRERVVKALFRLARAAELHLRNNSGATQDNLMYAVVHAYEAGAAGPETGPKPEPEPVKPLVVEENHSG